MVSISRLFIAGGLGLLCFIAVPWMAAPYVSDDRRQQIVDAYAWLAATSYWTMVLVRRVTGGYELTKRGYDADEQAMTHTVGGNKHHFRDPLGLSGRLAKKPISLVIEGVPTAVDIKLAELGKYHHEHATRDDLVQRDVSQVGDDTQVEHTINPYFEMPDADSLHVSDLGDAVRLLTENGDSTDAETTKQFTEAAMSKYYRQIGAAESLATILGFVVSLGAVVFLQRYILDSGAGGGGEDPGTIVGLGAAIPQVTIDLVVMAG